MEMKLKRYQNDFDHSYCLGVYPTLELLDFQPNQVLKVILHSKGDSNQGVKKIRQRCGELGIELLENDQMVDKLAQRGNTYAVGVFQKYSTKLYPKTDHLVLVNPSSMGNLGTIMRTMLGFGFRDLAIIEPAADLYHPKVVRASMGAIFQIRNQTFRAFTDYWGSQGKHNLYPFMTDGKIALQDLVLDSPCAMIFGDEASGLGEEYHQYGTSVRISQSDAVDSLNLALSVGIALYHNLVQHEKNT